MVAQDATVRPWYVSFKDKPFDQETDGSMAEICSLPDPKQNSCLDKQFVNIILLGLGFYCSFGAVVTCMSAQTVILNSVHDEYFTGTSTTGYISLAITFTAMAASFATAPAVSVLLGPRNAMIFGSICLTVSIATFVRPVEAVIYLGNVAQGIGAGIVWTVYGHFFTQNSTEKNIGRNTGVFWVLFQCGPVSLSLFYFFITRGASSISEETRYLFFMVLLPVSAVGVIMFTLLDRFQPRTQNVSNVPTILNGLNVQRLGQSKYQIAKEALRDELRMALSRKMFLFIPMFLFMGAELTFYVNVYGTSLGYSRQFGDLREALVGLHGVFVGVGQVVGGLTYGLLGGCQRRHGRDLGILLALFVHIVSYFLSYLVLPERAAFEMTSTTSLLPPSPYLAMVCSFLFGFGDAAWNNPLFGLLGIFYPHNPVAAFAIFQAYQSVGNVVAFAYSTVLPIPFQMGILIILAILGAFGFFLVDWKYVSDEQKSLAAATVSEPRNEKALQVTVL